VLIFIFKFYNILFYICKTVDLFTKLRYIFNRYEIHKNRLSLFLRRIDWYIVSVQIIEINFILNINCLR